MLALAMMEKYGQTRDGWEWGIEFHLERTERGGEWRGGGGE